MKIEFPALHSDALVYFLYHSGVFVLLLGGAFLILGLGLGYAFWGRFKQKARQLGAEAEAQKEEIADLKRKLAEQALRPVPPVEAVAPAFISAPELPPPPAPRFPPAPLIENVPAMPELGANPPMEPLNRPVRVTRPKPALAAPARPAKVEAAAIAPFSFLMDEPGQEPSSPDR